MIPVIRTVAVKCATYGHDCIDVFTVHTGKKKYQATKLVPVTVYKALEKMV